MNKDLKYLDILFKVAIGVEPIQSCRIAAGLVIGNEMVAVGTNLRKTHPLAARYSDDDARVTLHAEMDCIIQALHQRKLNDMKKGTLYIARAIYDGPKQKFSTWGNCKPCVGCERAIKAFKIKRVVYTEKGGTFEEI